MSEGNTAHMLKTLRKGHTLKNIYIYLKREREREREREANIYVHVSLKCPPQMFQWRVSVLQAKT